MDSSQRMENMYCAVTKSKITSLCFEVFCKVLSAQGEPQWLQHRTDSSLCSMPFVSFHLAPLIHCNLDSISTKRQSSGSESACLNRTIFSLLLPKNHEVLILEQNPKPVPRKRVICILIFSVCFKKTGFQIYMCTHVHIHKYIHRSEINLTLKSKVVVERLRVHMLQKWVLNHCKYHNNCVSGVRLLAFDLENRIPHLKFPEFN